MQGTQWPRSVPRIFRPVAEMQDPLRRLPYDEAHAYRIARSRERVKAAIESPAWGSAFFTNRADFTAVASTASEASLLAGLNLQPTIPAGHFDGTRGFGRTISFKARGVLSTTSTPTIIFQWRMSSTAGSATLSGASLGVSAAITTASGVTNKYWESQLDLICNTPGQGTGNTTLSSAGFVKSGGGFASPFDYPLEITTPDTGTWTQTFDSTLTYYVNLSVTWGTSSSSNTITCKHLSAYSWN